MSTNLNFPTTLMAEIEQTLYRQERPEYDYASLIPVRTDINPNATSVISFSVKENGEAKPVTGKPGEQLPKVDFSASMKTVNILTLGMSYDISLDDIMTSQNTGNFDPLLLKMESTFNGFGAGTQRMALTGNTEANIVGLSNIPNKTVDPENGITETPALAASARFDADNAVAKAVIKVITDAMTQVRKNTLYARNPDTIVMSGEAYDAIVSLRNEQTGQTVLQAIQETSTAMLGRPINIVASPYFGKDMLVYAYDPAVLSMFMAVPLTFRDPQPSSLGYEVPSYFRISPIQVRNSKAFHRVKGVVS